MKKNILIAFIILALVQLSIQIFALANYPNHKKITIHGSSAGILASGSVVQIRVSPDADPVQSGIWTVNSKTYYHRIAIPMTEVSHTNITNQLAWFEVRTNVLVSRGFFCTSPHGYEVEFADSTGSTTYQYRLDTALFNGLRTRYFVPVSMTADSSLTIYMYLDSSIDSQSSNYNENITPSNSTIDNRYLPKINFPLLVMADVFLDGDSSFPYGFAFTKSDGATKLTWNEAGETLKTGTDNCILFNVKLADDVPQSGNLIIHIWYGNASLTTRDSSWTNTSAHIFYDDFESGTSLWSTASGTWTTADQQHPISKGGFNGFAQAPFCLQKDGKYYLYSWDLVNWNFFTEYGGGSGALSCDVPGLGVSYSVGNNLTDFIYHNYQAFDDRNSASCAWEPSEFIGPVWGNSMAPNSVVQDPNDGTYWMTYSNCSNDSTTHKQAVYLAHSTDAINWTASVNNPIIPGDQDTVHVYNGQTGSGYLFWDTSVTPHRWIMYTLPIIGDGIHDGTVYAWTRVNASPDGPFTYYGIVRPGMATSGWYGEEVCVVKNGSNYFMYFGDLHGLDGYMGQSIRYAYSSTPLGTFTEGGLITLPAYAGDYALQGMSKLWRDTNDNAWYMVYLGRPKSPLNLSEDCAKVDDFFYLAKATTMTTGSQVWSPQNLHKELKASSAGVSVVSGGSYSNHSIYSSILLGYTSTEVGLVVGYADINNYYRVTINRSDNKIYLKRVSDGSTSTLTSVSIPWTLKYSGVHHPLMVCVYGSTISVKISQYGDFWYTLIDYYDTGSTISGNMGVYDANALSYFDDVAIDNYIYPEPTLTSTASVSILPPYNVGGAGVEVSWNAVDDSYLAGYNIYFGLASQQYDYNDDVGDITHYDIHGLQRGHTWYFAVSAYDTSLNESVLSTEASVYLPYLDGDQNREWVSTSSRRWKNTASRNWVPLVASVGSVNLVWPRMYYERIRRMQ